MDEDLLREAEAELAAEYAGSIEWQRLGELELLEEPRPTREPWTAGQIDAVRRAEIVRIARQVRARRKIRIFTVGYD